MGRRGTIVLLVLVAAIAGYLWFEEPPREEPAAASPTLLGEPRLRDPNSIVPLVVFPPDGVTRLRIAHSGGRFDAERREGRWSGASSGAAIDVFLRNLTELGRLMEIPAQEGQLKDYGLAAPEAVIEINLAERPAPLTVEVGRANPAGTGVYARVDRAGPVILAGALLTWEIDKLLRPVE
jgi:hypothetical protein